MKDIKNLFKNLEQSLLALLIAMHVWALVAFNLPTLRGIFLPLTPLNLLISAFVIFKSYRGQTLYVFALASAIYLLGFFIEAIGVNTGFPFGEYVYGNVLGPKVWDTPIIIGINWFIMFSGILYAIELIRLPILIKALAGATLMTASDYLIEPVAISLEFWTWDKGLPPVENYMGWFVVSFGMYLLYYKFFKSVVVTKNAFWVVSIFVLFFVFQNLII
ncbi:MAG: carotenoid biosynthesis protein [Thermaurantimonas sp.]|uniref:carotenoid biosynthesis protein n=1 Tax=Thermaurantimonas sp. TaxID=2681568 RepID=UPI00391C6BA7